MGINVKTGVKQYLTSWKSETEPSSGKYTIGISPESPPQGYGWNGTAIYLRTGHWDRLKFIGIPEMDHTYLSGVNIQQDIGAGTTYLYMYNYTSCLYKFMYVSVNGTLTVVTWIDEVKRWIKTWRAPSTSCQIYGSCGPFGVCSDSKSPICSCLVGFVPTSKEEWRRGNWTAGCVRKSELRCEGNKSTGASSSGSSRKGGFRKMSRMKLPDSSTLLSSLKDSEECQSWCRTNCSCLAYSYVGTIGCLVWTDGELVDMVEFPTEGQDLFIRYSGTAVINKVS